jgi:branched-subunit amino acid transport protein
MELTSSGAGAGAVAALTRNATTTIVRSAAGMSLARVSTGPPS